MSLLKNISTRLLIDHFDFFGECTLSVVEIRDADVRAPPSGGILEEYTTVYREKKGTKKHQQQAHQPFVLTSTARLQVGMTTQVAGAHGPNRARDRRPVNDRRRRPCGGGGRRGLGGASPGPDHFFRNRFFWAVGTDASERGHESRILWICPSQRT